MPERHLDFEFEVGEAERSGGSGLHTPMDRRSLLQRRLRAGPGNTGGTRGLPAPSRGPVSSAPGPDRRSLSRGTL